MVDHHPTCSWFETADDYTHVLDILTPNYSHCIKTSQCLRTPNISNKTKKAKMLTSQKRGHCTKLLMSPGHNGSCVCLVLLLDAFIPPDARRTKNSKNEHFSKSHAFSDSDGYTDHKRQVRHRNSSITIHRGTAVQLKTIVGSGIWQLIPIRRRIGIR